jgi:hypothetical protein
MGLPFTIFVGFRQHSNSRVGVSRDSWTYFTVSDSRLPQPWGQNPRIFILQEQGEPIIHPDTGFPFRPFLRLAGLRCLGILHTYIDAARTRITENTCHVLAIQPVYWRPDWTYRKHVTWPLLTVVCRHRGHKENTAAILLAACVLRALSSNGFTCHNEYYK